MKNFLLILLVVFCIAIFLDPEYPDDDRVDDIGDYSVTHFGDSIMIHYHARVLAKLPASEFGVLDSIIIDDNQ